MKKIISLLVVLVSLTGLSSAVSAKDQARVKMGFVSFKSVSNGSGSSLAASSISDRVQISIGGAKGTSSGVLTIFLPNSFVSTLETGDSLDVTSFANDDSNSALISVLGTKVKINGLNSSTTGIASTNASSATGTLKVIKYDAATKELKFSLNAKISNWTKSSSKGITAALTTSEVSKPTAVVAQVVITLP